MIKPEYLIVGAGLTGSTFARVKANAGFKVRVIDKRPHLAGNAYDFPSNQEDSKADQLLVHAYGPHIFHTNSKRIFDFLSDFTDWTPYEHKVLAQVNGKLVPLPFNFKSIDLLFDSAEATNIKNTLSWEFQEGTRVTLKRLKLSNFEITRVLHDFIYNLIFKNYTEKMWGLTLESLGPTVADRVPVEIGYDDRYFIDTYQAIPSKGYSYMVSNLLDHSNIRVDLNTSFEDISAEGQKIFYTGSMDGFYKNSLGSLPYRSVSFSFSDSYENHHPDSATINYPSHQTITRSTSMKALLSSKSSSQDVVIVETPEEHSPGRNEPLYPTPTIEAKTLYEDYSKLNTNENLVFAGRLGSFQYLNMDQAVAQALKLSESF